MDSLLNMKNSQGLLSGVKVVELGCGVSAPYCGKVLAQLGAEVIKVEPPEGDWSRRMGPFPKDKPHAERSGLYLAMNANKFGVTLDPSSSVGQERLHRLVDAADIFVESTASGDFSGYRPIYSDLKKSNASLVMTSISSFGDWGPYADYKATDLVLYHMSGQAHGLLGPVEDPDSEPPIRAGGHQALQVAGMAAATATMMALFRRRMTGEGSHVKVSEYEALVTQGISALAGCAFGRPAPPRALSEVREAATGGVVAAVGGVLPCTDGYVAISPREEAQWTRWVELMGNPEWANEECFANREGRESNFPELWELVSQWTRQHSKHDIARWGQETRIPCFPVNTVLDLFNDRHLADREFFVESDHPVAGVLKYPGVPYKLANTELPLNARPAPLLGQHNDLVFGATR